MEKQVKLNEILDATELTEEQLNEITSRQVIAAGAIALAALGINKRLDDKAWYAKQMAIAAQQAAEKPSEKQNKEFQKLQLQLTKMAEIIKTKYKKDEKEALSFAALAKKHEKTTFPKAKTLLSLMGVESSFDSTAVSKLKKDPAVGVLQIRPKKWGLDAGELKRNVDMQVGKASDILNKLYVSLGSEEEAIKAYNIGKRNLMKGEKDMMDAADRYLAKYKREIKEYDGV